ncbi:MAG: hypothetical protein ACKOWF_02675, partial [Chloroflexota bacterium]
RRRTRLRRAGSGSRSAQRSGGGERCVRLGAGCTRQTACCAGGACRNGACACGGKSAPCGARCFPLIRHGYRPGACDRLPGTTFCADGFCRKSAIAGDVTCSCGAECCADPAPSWRLAGRCCPESGASCSFGGDAVCCCGVCRDTVCA